MNNFGRLPTCKDHFSFRICLLDTISLETIRNWVTAPENSEKARKKRSRRRFFPKTSPDLIINYIYNLSGGTICAGKNCFQSLWLYTGASEFDTRTDLQYYNLTATWTGSPSSPNASKKNMPSRTPTHTKVLQYLEHHYSNNSMKQQRTLPNPKNKTSDQVKNPKVHQK